MACDAGLDGGVGWAWSSPGFSSRGLRAPLWGPSCTEPSGPHGLGGTLGAQGRGQPSDGEAAGGQPSAGRPFGFAFRGPRRVRAHRKDTGRPAQCVPGRRGSFSLDLGSVTHLTILPWDKDSLQGAPAKPRGRCWGSRHSPRGVQGGGRCWLTPVGVTASRRRNGALR